VASSPERLVTAGRVGRPHGLDGSFAVLAPAHGLNLGTCLMVAGEQRTVDRRDGTDARPLIRLSGIGDRDAAAAIGGEALLVSEADTPLEQGEWLAEDLIGCEVADLGTVAGVLAGPSCDVLELTGGVLVPLIADAVRSVDLDRRRIEVDSEFLGLDRDR
jgi:16S rRNA processing protein RimM